MSWRDRIAAAVFNREPRPDHVAPVPPLSLAELSPRPGSPGVDGPPAPASEPGAGGQPIDFGTNPGSCWQLPPDPIEAVVAEIRALHDLLKPAVERFIDGVERGSIYTAPGVHFDQFTFGEESPIASHWPGVPPRFVPPN